jgi:hypothetical protein
VEHARSPDDLYGSIDTPAIKEMIKDLLERGQGAFETDRVGRRKLQSRGSSCRWLRVIPSLGTI